MNRPGQGDLSFMIGDRTDSEVPSDHVLDGLELILVHAIDVNVQRDGT
jgi:hypothetical protein